MNKIKYLWALVWVLLFLLAASVFRSAVGSETVSYQCKYITSVDVLVKDHEKYATALYALNYSDGTKGVTSDVDVFGPKGSERGVACKTIFQWGFPYEFTNRNVTDESSVRTK